MTTTPGTPGSYSSATDEDLATVYEYDHLGNQKAVIDPMGRRTTYDYDALNRVITITNPLDDETVYTYDSAGNRTQIVNPNSQIVNYQYDALNRVITTTNHLDGETVVIYDKVGNRTQTIDAEENATLYRYDTLYRLEEVEDAETQITSYTYDALGNRLTETDAEDRVTKFEYDTLNRLTVTTLNFEDGGPSNADTNVTTETKYDALSRRIEMIDGRSNSTWFGYDKLGRTIAITDSLIHVTTTVYDGLGQRRFVTNAENETIEYQYDGVGRLVKVIDPLTHDTAYHYNEAGERTIMIDAEDIETHYDYDNLGRLTQVIENFDDGTPTSATDQDIITQYGYDAMGNRTVITNARGFTTTYVYDDLNRRTQMQDALGNLTRYGYDAVGNQTVITDANTIITIFDYDDVYRLTDITYSDSTPDVTFTYDKVGNRETMLDGTGTTTYGYDKLNRLTSVNDGASQQVGYGYDEIGNRTSLTYPSSQGTIIYQYDNANRLDTVTGWNSEQFEYTYDDANRMTDLVLPNAITSSYIYDDAGRLQRLTHINPTNPLADYDYDLDKVGNRTVLTETLSTVPALPYGTFLENDGLIVMEGEHFDQTNAGPTHTWLITTTHSGYTGTSYIQAEPDIDERYQTNNLTDSPMLTYPLYITTPATYTIWLRGWAPNGAGDSVYVEAGGVLTAVTGFTPRQWSWANLEISDGVPATSLLETDKPATLALTTTGLYTLNFRMREDGLLIDRVLLTTDTTYIPSGFGPAESGRIGINTVPPTIPLDRVLTYHYDNLYRLTDADYSTGDVYDYEYDPVGNRLQQIINGHTTDYLYDAANRLEQLDGQPVYTFDDNGNLLSSDMLTNTFDAANRLTNSINSKNPINSVTPIYNGVNDRVGQTVDGVTTNYALDVQGLPEVIYTSDDNAYLHLPGVIITESAAGEVRYLLSDGLGSVRQVFDEGALLVSYQEFDPYGNVVQGGEIYGYTGEWWQDEVGLLHLRARWYAPGDRHVLECRSGGE